MTYQHFKHEGWLYLLAFAIAITLRFAQLGHMPLSDVEAAPALQALRISQSAATELAPHPLYILSTSIIFLLFGGGTNTLARIIPALVGSLLVVAPLLFDNRIKPRPSLLLAFFIAIDPGLVAISRQAASPILAIVFTVLTVGFINKNKFSWAAVTAAFALLSGSSLWLGLLGIGIAYSIYQLAQTFIKKTADHSEESDLPTTNLRASLFTPANGLTLVFTFLLAGTLFFIVPGGLGAAFSSIPAFVNTWFDFSTTTSSMVLISLLVYQPFAVLLALIALIRGWVKGLRRVIFLSIWLLVALLLVIFLPARQIADLAWVLIPLNALAALELVRHLKVFPEERREVAGVTFLTVFIWLFAWLGMAGINWFPADSAEFRLRIGILIGAVFLLVLSLLLVAMGWSIRVARIGGVWGMAIGLGLLGLSGLFGAGGMRGLSFPELWWQPSLPLQADLLRETVNEVSEMGTGSDDSASVVIVGINSPALEWALREKPVQVVNTLDPTSVPDMVITSFELNPTLVSAYRGQDFNWRQTPIWAASTPDAWFRWVTLREMPQTGEVIILWARSDLFLDN